MVGQSCYHSDPVGLRKVRYVKGGFIHPPINEAAFMDEPRGMLIDLPVNDI